MASENDNNKDFRLKIEIEAKVKVEVENIFLKIRERITNKGIKLITVYSRFQNIFA
jgi:hypothetical protein